MMAWRPVPMLSITQSSLSRHHLLLVAFFPLARPSRLETAKPGLAAVLGKQQMRKPCATGSSPLSLLVVPFPIAHPLSRRPVVACIACLMHVSCMYGPFYKPLPLPYAMFFLLFCVPTHITYRIPYLNFSLSFPFRI